jgi:O-antigen ligase
VFLVWAAVPPAGGIASDTSVYGRFTTIASAASTPDRSVQDRYDLWQTALSIWRDHPVTGVGLKQFAAFRDSRAPLGLSSDSDVADPSLSFRREPLLSPHNMYLLVLSEQGIVGAFGFLALFGTVGIRAVRRTRAEHPEDGAVAVGLVVWTAVNFVSGDIGGPTTVLMSVLFGLSASVALRAPSRVNTATNANLLVGVS